jgi:F0F1-type ATP synthase membrane subunit b/b'
MDTNTIKALLKIAEANLKVARREFNEIRNHPNQEDELEWEEALDDAGRETYACEEVVRFLKANLEYISNIEHKFIERK